MINASMIPLKRSYTLIRVARPNNKDKPFESFIFDEDENEALDHFLGLLDVEKMSYEKVVYERGYTH